MKTAAEKFRDDEDALLATFQTAWEKLSKLGLLHNTADQTIPGSAAAPSSLPSLLLAAVLPALLALAAKFY